MTKKELKELIANGYSSAQVVGRGTIKICPKEVRNSPEFKEALEKAKEIVEASRAGSSDHRTDGTLRAVRQAERRLKALLKVSLNAQAGYAAVVMDTYGPEPEGQFYKDLTYLLVELEMLREEVKGD